MSYQISIFSSAAGGVSATGSWQVNAESREDAIGMAKFYANPMYWPPGSTWLCIPLEEGPDQWEAGIWNPA